MSKKPYRWPWFFKLLLIAVGAAMVWGFTVGYSVETFYFHRLRNPRIRETLQIRADGEAIILSHDARISRTLPSRTVSGDLVPPDSVHIMLNGAGLYRPAEQLSTISQSWTYRIGQLNVKDATNGLWWLVRDLSAEGLTYLAGFDAETRLPIGFIGRRGFRSETPPTAEQFALGTINIHSPIEAKFQRDAQSPYEWFVYLLDGAKLQEIHLRTRKVRTVAELPGVLAVTVVAWPLADDDREERERPEVPNRDTSRGNAVTRVAVWLGDHIAILDPTSGERTDWMLPDDVRDVQGFQVYFIRQDQAVVEWMPDPRSYSHRRIIWIAPNGETTRDETVELAWSRNLTNREGATAAALIVPIPAVFVSIAAWTAGSSVVTGQPREFWNETAQIMNDAWPAVLGVAVVCVAMAAFVYWQERRRGGDHPLAWSVTAFWLGLPGLVAYLAERRPTALGRCDACGQPAPRNRPACTRCGQDFPRPRLLGTEVFA